MLKIRLTRKGKKNQPEYRLIVQEARSKRDGKYADSLGFYRPLDNPATIEINQEKYRHWIAQGAQPTPTVKHLYEKLTGSTSKTAPQTKTKPTIPSTASKTKIA